MEIAVKTSKRCEIIDITSKIAHTVKGTGVATVFVNHTTAGLTINENADPDVQRDILMKLDDLASDDDYRHVEGNSDAHVKASLVGSSVQVIVKEGDLQLGKWQSIFLCEFDGPRERRITIHQ